MVKMDSKIGLQRILQIPFMLTLLGSFAGFANAEDAMGQAAAALLAYQNSDDACYYEDIVGVSIAKVDNFLSRSQPYEWEAAKQRAAGSDTITNNLAQLAGAEPCAGYGLLVGGGLARALGITGFDPLLMEAIDRLFAKGGGRAKDSGAAEWSNKKSAAEEDEISCQIRIGISSYFPQSCNIKIQEDVIYLEWKSAREHWVQLHLESDGGSFGYWNGVSGGTHAHDSLGVLRRDGGCWVNDNASICYSPVY